MANALIRPECISHTVIVCISSFCVRGFWKYIFCWIIAPLEKNSHLLQFQFETASFWISYPWTLPIIYVVTLGLICSCGKWKHTSTKLCRHKWEAYGSGVKGRSLHMPGWASWTNSSQQFFWIRHCGAKSLAFGIPPPVQKVCLLSFKPPFVKWLMTQWTSWQQRGKTGKDQV